MNRIRQYRVRLVGLDLARSRQYELRMARDRARIPENIDHIS